MYCHCLIQSDYYDPTTKLFITCFHCKILLPSNESMIFLSAGRSICQLVIYWHVSSCSPFMSLSLPFILVGSIHLLSIQALDKCEPSHSAPYCMPFSKNVLLYVQHSHPYIEILMFLNLLKLCFPYILVPSWVVLGDCTLSLYCVPGKSMCSGVCDVTRKYNNTMVCLN